VKHQCVGGGDLVDVGTSTTMVQKASTIAPTTVDGENKGMIIAPSAL
jgi:hypothetical protein